MTGPGSVTSSYDDLDLDFPQTWNQYSYANNNPLSLIDPLGPAVCRPTVKLHLPNGSKDDEASGEFGPYEPQGDSAAGEQAPDPPGYSGCAGGGNPWDTFTIDGVDAGGLSLFMDLGFGGPGGRGAAVGSFGDCPTFACEPTVTGHDGMPHTLSYAYTPLYQSQAEMLTATGEDVSATVFGTLGWVEGPAQTSFSLLPMPLTASSPGGDGTDSLVELGRTVTGFAKLMRPLQFAAANFAMGWTGAAAVGLGAGIALAGCLDPTPFEPVTCVGGLAAGAMVGAQGVGALALAGYFFVNQTIPAFKAW